MSAHEKFAGNPRALEPLGRFADLTHTVLSHARSRSYRSDFLEATSRTLFEHSGCDAVEWWLEEGDGFFRLEVLADGPSTSATATVAGHAVGELYLDIIAGHFDPLKTCFTARGTFWTGDARAPLEYVSPKNGRLLRHDLAAVGSYRSLVLIPLLGENRNIGFVMLKSRSGGFFSDHEVAFFEAIAGVLTVALTNQKAQAALDERAKEIGCLYAVVRLAADRSHDPLADLFQGIVELLPPAMRFPEKTGARIVFDGRAYASFGCCEGEEQLRAAITVGGQLRGFVEVVQGKSPPPAGDRSFLKEEDHLVTALAREIAGIVERRKALEEKARLEEQLRHADRLSTIGQLAAGVAHELNEPLSTILGFAQLTEKSASLPDGARSDIVRIVTAALHAREIVRKLKLFARQMPERRGPVSLNEIIADGSFFIEAHKRKQPIQVVADLARDLPEIDADAGQLHQVFVNLAVNAIQAMPDGGTLAIRTRAHPDAVSLIVEDTGIGMSAETMQKIFLPFFTTKDIDQGTGLGLSVVHGIVTAHGGTIDVRSRPGEGSAFEVRLPRSGDRAGG